MQSQLHAVAVLGIMVSVHDAARMKIGPQQHSARRHGGVGYHAAYGSIDDLTAVS